MQIKYFNNLQVSYYLACILACLIILVDGPSAQAQGTVTTRKYRLADFPDKVTKVVLSGNEILSGSLRQEVVNGWTISAFEFCSTEEFDKLKTSDNYYFLLAAETLMKGEETPGLLFLTLVKGGAEAAEGIGAMNEVISLPLTSAPGGTGRELLYLGALLQAVQEFTLAAMESEKVAYSGSDWFNGNYKRHIKQKQLFFSQDDLSPALSDRELVRYQDEDMHVVEEEQADQAFLDGTYNGLVSYVVAPLFPEKGSFSYQLLFAADTHTLFYISKHKISDKQGAGFLPEDLKRLAKRR